MATLTGTAGNDVLRAQADGDLLRGLAGDDTLLSGFNDTTLQGGAGADYLFTRVSDLSSPSAGVRGVLDGGAGADTLIADTEAESASGPVTAANIMRGGAGLDAMTATASATTGYDSQSLCGDCLEHAPRRCGTRRSECRRHRRGRNCEGA